MVPQAGEGQLDQCTLRWPAPCRACAGGNLLMGSVAAVAASGIESARDAGLRYVTDSTAGLSRRRRGRGFVYVDQRGRQVRDARTLDRIRALAIPPAWRDVWISPDPRGHVQATGRDARSRKQYRYHPRWTASRDETKYGRMELFGRSLPALRRRVARDLKQPTLSRPRVLATVVTLLERTLIRVGNDEYARANRSFGLTTLEDRHVRVRGTRLRFKFRAKSGVQQVVEVNDARLARSVKHCQDLPGQILFQYLDASGTRQSVGSIDVNAYLRDATGEDFTAKDFRTWAGTVLAACALGKLEAAASDTARKRQVTEVVTAVASRLGNTPAVCRRCYIHPGVVDAYLTGKVVDRGSARLRESRMSAEEASVLAFLRRLSRGASGTTRTPRRA
jgi:DNA topoisomerase-1